MSIPTEDDEMIIHSSTQNPTEVQHLAAHVLNVPQNAIEVVTRRMGGGFGGKKQTLHSWLAFALSSLKKQKNQLKQDYPEKTIFF
jgi:xanthine dehydrogenase large subunit